MNLDKKLELAHDYAVKILDGEVKIKDIPHLIDASWLLADEMEKQYNKRKPSGLPNVLIPPSSRELEWQPDWSKAPTWANWWATDLDNSQPHWYETEPSIDITTWRRKTRVCKQAPSFNYQGDWKDSLCKRSDFTGW